MSRAGKPAAFVLATVENFMIRAGKPAEFVLATVRSFPTLEPKAIQPVSAKILGLEPRRDILWQAVMFERDAERAGSKTILGRSDMGYSRIKLRPQKGSGRARMGDRGNPIRHDGGRAHNKHAPLDHSTGLPASTYALAVRHALSLKYNENALYIIDGQTEFSRKNELIGKHFLNQHSASNVAVTFVTSGLRENLFDSTITCPKVDIVPQELVRVQDILKAKRLFIERSAFEYLCQKFPVPDALRNIQPAPVA